MAESVTNELMYETLKALRADLLSLRSEVRDYRADNLALKGHVMALMQTDLNKDGMIAEVRVRLDRIETRLNLHGGEA